MALPWTTKAVTGFAAALLPVALLLPAPEPELVVESVILPDADSPSGYKVIIFDDIPPTIRDATMAEVVEYEMATRTGDSQVTEDEREVVPTEDDDVVVVYEAPETTTSSPPTTHRSTAPSSTAPPETTAPTTTTRPPESTTTTTSLLPTIPE